MGSIVLRAARAFIAHPSRYKHRGIVIYGGVGYYWPIVLRTRSSSISSATFYRRGKRAPRTAVCGRHDRHDLDAGLEIH